jgi:peptidoglycan-associated lipoprotein
MNVGPLILLFPVLARAACATNSTTPRREGGEQTGIIPGYLAGLVVNIPDKIYFRFDSAVLSKGAEEILRRQADYLRKYRRTEIQIAGHSDERGTGEDNIGHLEKYPSPTRVQ